MGAAAGIMIAKEELEFPDAAIYREWPAHSVALCLENYLSLRSSVDMDMDGQIPVRLESAALSEWADPPFGLTLEPFLSGVARLTKKGEMDRSSIRRASNALGDGELLMVKDVAAGSPAHAAGVEVDWLLATVCGRIPPDCAAAAAMCAAVDPAVDRLTEFHFTAGPFNRSGAPPLAISRPLWLHVFADPTETNDHGECLSLPLTAMRAFASAFPDGPAGTAAARPALIILALLCQDSLTSKLEMVFSCLDVKNKLTIPAAELGASVRLLGETLVHARYLRTALDDAAVTSLADALKGHCGANGRLTCEGFVEWGRRESKGGVLAALAHSATGRLGKYRKPVTLDAAKSREAHRRAERRFGSGHAQRNAKSLGVSIADAEHRGDQSAKYELEKVRKRVDGRVKAVASQATMARLVASASLSYEDLHNLRIEFAEASDRTGKDGPYLSCARLKEMLLARFPSLENGRVLGDMLRVFDVSGRNRIYFPEFARAIARLVGSFEEQMTFIFDLCDKDASGSLELWELSDLLSDAADDMAELGEHIKKRIPGFDDGGGFADINDFEALLKGGAHLYLNFYWTWLPFIGGPLLAGLERLEACCRSKRVSVDTDFALGLCPKFSSLAGLAANGDWKLSNLQFGTVFFDALGVDLPKDESFRALDVPPPVDAKIDALSAASPVGDKAADAGAGGRADFFAEGADAGGDAFAARLREATTTVFREVLAASKADCAEAEGDADPFGNKPTAGAARASYVDGARLWAVCAHFFAARGTERNPTARFRVPLRILQKLFTAVESNSFPAVSWDRPVLGSP